MRLHPVRARIAVLVIILCIDHLGSLSLKMRHELSSVAKRMLGILFGEFGPIKPLYRAVSATRLSVRQTTKNTRSTEPRPALFDIVGTPPEGPSELVPGDSPRRALRLSALPDDFLHGLDARTEIAADDISLEDVEVQKGLLSGLTAGLLIDHRATMKNEDDIRAAFRDHHGLLPKTLLRHLASAGLDLYLAPEGHQGHRADGGVADPRLRLLTAVEWKTDLTCSTAGIEDVLRHLARSPCWLVVLPGDHTKFFLYPEDLTLEPILIDPNVGRSILQGAGYTIRASELDDGKKSQGVSDSAVEVETRGAGDDGSSSRIAGSTSARSGGKGTRKATALAQAVVAKVASEKENRDSVPSPAAELASIGGDQDAGQVRHGPKKGTQSDSAYRAVMISNGSAAVYLVRQPSKLSEFRFGLSQRFFLDHSELFRNTR